MALTMTITAAAAIHENAGQVGISSGGGKRINGASARPAAHAPMSGNNPHAATTKIPSRRDELAPATGMAAFSTTEADRSIPCNHGKVEPPKPQSELIAVTCPGLRA
jgi:hypothetical protein